MEEPEKQNFKAMSDRFLKGWTFQRFLYLVIGGFVMAQAVVERHWMIMVIGGYFAAMAIFNFGCAAGCYGSVCSTGKEVRQDRKSLDTNINEIN